LSTQEKNGPNKVTHLREISPEQIELIPEGSLAREDMTDFQSWLDRALLGGHRTIALNFEDVKSISSSAIGKILHFKKTCDEMGRHLLIRNCGAEMLQLLKMIKFDALIEIEPSQDLRKS
jgi:anti-anti-sigma factor